MKLAAESKHRKGAVDEALVASFESAWSHSTGPTRIEDYLVAPDVSLETLAELVRIDLELGFSHGRRTTLAEYLQRFPQLRSEPGLLSEVAFEEFRLRRAAGEKVTPADYQGEYGIDPAGWPDWSTASAPFSSVAIRQGNSFAWRHAEPARQFPTVPGRLFGFDLTGLLGSGAFGRVYLARQDDLARRLVALKVSRQPSAEPQHLAMLQHTNIVPIFSVHRQGNWQAICMPFLGVATLADVVRHQAENPSYRSGGREMISTVAARLASTLVTQESGRPESFQARSSHESQSGLARFAAIGDWNWNETAAWMMRQLADGLSAAHRQGLIHGDLKPANILISDDGQPLLLDFHLAQRRQLSEETEVAGGTLPYMAPEHLAGLVDGGTIDERSDLYSLGAVFYQLLSGRTPYPIQSADCESVLNQLRQDQRQPAPDLQRVAPDVDPDLAAIIGKCLKPNRSDRYLSAVELRTDLDRHLTNRPLQFAANRSWGQRFRKWARRHPRISSAGSVATFLGIGLLAVIFWSWGWARQAQQLAGSEDSRKYVEAIRQARIPLMVKDGSDQSDQQAEAQLRELLAQVQGERPARQTSLWSKLSPSQRQLERQAITDAAYWLANYYLQRADAPGRESPMRSEYLQAAKEANRCSLAIADPESPAPAHLLQAAQIASAEGQLAEAKRWRRAAQSSQPQSLADRLHLASQWRQPGPNQNIEAAIQLLRELVAEAPTDYAAWLLLGNIYAQVRRDADAIACFTVGHGLDRRDDRAIFNRGLTYLAMGDDAQAAADFSEAISRNPHDANSYANRAIASRHLGQLQAAIDDLTQAITAGSSQTRLYYLRSEIFRELGQDRRAQADQLKFLELVPSDADSWWQRGMVHYAQGNTERALADLQTAIELDPDSLEAVQNKAHIHSERLNQLEPAIELMSHLVARRPADSTVRVTRGVLQARAQRREEAIADAAAALQISSDPDTLYRAAGVYALTSREQPADRDRAFECLALSIRQNPAIALKYLPIDPDLEPLQIDPRMAELRSSLNTIVTMTGQSAQ